MKHKDSTRINSNSECIYNFSPDMYPGNQHYNKGTYFLFYGRFVKEKGIETLINAWLLKKRKTNLKIVGEGPMRNDYLKMTGGINKNIEIMDFLQGEQLSKIIENASFIVVPSEWYENNPMTIIEAYSYGKPVIAAKTGGIPEMVVENYTGYLFEARNTYELSEVIEKAESITLGEYSILAGNSRELYESRFSEEVHYNKLLKAYRSACNINI